MNIESDGPRDTRPNWDQWCMGLARAASERADCSRRKVGAVLRTADGRVLHPAYNGAPSGVPGCLTAGACPRASSDAEGLISAYDQGSTRCIAVHAEKNAMLRASWDEMTGATLYVTCEPCYLCRTDIAGSPIHRVVYDTEGGMVVMTRTLSGWTREFG